MPHQFKFLNDCDSLELVRVKLNDEAALAIIGATEPQSRRGFIVLEGAKAPRYVNFMHEGLIDGDFEHYQMLSYGKNYQIVSNELGGCGIGNGPLFKQVGALVLAKQDRLLVVTDHPSQVRYFNLKTGLMQGEPAETARAAFGCWALHLSEIEVPLIKFG